MIFINLKKILNTVYMLIKNYMVFCRELNFEDKKFGLEKTLNK